ncbi:hypothetical protein EIP86_000832 [Pleurotus ostreatoroseus]|nr:hypothetical protein EIP86_000832 [Pleurotus ostreatoroseus]
MAEPAWQEALRLRLVERNARESAYSPIIEQCAYKFLASDQLDSGFYISPDLAPRMLKRSQIGTTDEAAEGTKCVATSSHGNGASQSKQLHCIRSGNCRRNSNPVRAAYITSLESQISSLRDELATVYKTQGQNAQRLLAMTETLREKEELSRLESESLRKARDEISNLRRKVDQHNELMTEKDRTAQILHDEINTLQLELGQIEERNQTLAKDNAKLLQRWLDAKQAEVNKMNEANDFYEDMQSQRQAVMNWRQDSTASESGAEAQTSQGSGSGNGEVQRNSGSTMMKDGTPSRTEKDLSLTPNG